VGTDSPRPREPRPATAAGAFRLDHLDRSLPLRETDRAGAVVARRPRPSRPRTPPPISRARQSIAEL